MEVMSTATEAALDHPGRLMCSWGGVIQVVNPGQMNMIV